MRWFLLVAATFSALGTGAVAQQTNATRQAAIFLEQILRPWALVLPEWTRDPSGDEWSKATTLCETPARIDTVKPVGNADPIPPPATELFGSLAFYRGKSGLQLLNMSDGVAKLYPDIKVSRTANDTPIYQVGNAAEKITVAIGATPVNGERKVIMAWGNALYLSCRQPSEG